ncbi:nucleotidyltransferase domain-containing protein [Sunxiuqinia dokdonensis]|uniref:DNA polymerase n=1 Tax=Sunxiuqinia dokdonensis TaxID=1409788 RepID=A0A0L8V4C5_9BACT|nr:nucleotidyltransferase domain-containing protein [Sunxiuqinia dokdonensis]KOH43193.1 DNA polymerase [Sunxiuqinia dokdonensis]
MPHGLNDSDIQLIREVLQQYPEVKQAILYGSRAKGNYRPASDIDLSLTGPKLTIAHLLAIENQLDDLLLPYKIDLSLFHTIENPSLLDHINRVGILFYEQAHK